jgi:AcrR family transcriptional regulator
MLRQQRTTLYFIDAARDIIGKEGIKAVTIRSVSDLAGYTSATLYNYFDNLNHIITLATMDYLEAYAKDAAQAVASLSNPVDIYLAAAECFFLHSFENPDIFEILFVANRDSKLEEYTQQYYSLYPKRYRLDAELIFRSARSERDARPDSPYLANCVSGGYLAQDMADDFNSVAMMIYKCLLHDVSESVIGKDMALAEIMRLCRQQLGFYSSNSLSVR